MCFRTRNDEAEAGTFCPETGGAFYTPASESSVRAGNHPETTATAVEIFYVPKERSRRFPGTIS